MPPEVMPALQGMIDDEDANVRQAAQHALKGIDPNLAAQRE
jgi:HEAT repeat protein